MDDDLEEEESYALKHPMKGTKHKPAPKKKLEPAPKKKLDKKGNGDKVAKCGRAGVNNWKLNPDARQLMKRPARAPRPPFSLKPTQHAGGRIYFVKSKSIFRVYKRFKDRIESSVPELGDKKGAFQYSCALIEADPRPAK